MHLTLVVEDERSASKVSDRSELTNSDGMRENIYVKENMKKHNNLSHQDRIKQGIKPERIITKTPIMVNHRRGKGGQTG